MPFLPSTAKSTMITQHEFILGCQKYYAENYYEPGNPEDGEWHDAHYPVPECKGGTETVPLLKQHHAIQGVLQSEEEQHPCIHSWEKWYLTGELLKLYYKWKGVSAKTMREGWDKYSEEERRIKKQAAIQKARNNTPPGVLSQRGKERAAKMSAEERSLNVKKGWEGMTEEQVKSRTAPAVDACKKPVEVTLDGKTLVLGSLAEAAIHCGVHRTTLSNIIHNGSRNRKGITARYVGR